MDSTITIFQNISSYIGDFSGFNNEDEEKFMRTCELYNVNDCTDRANSFVIIFKDSYTYQLFENILFGNINRNLFDDRNSNGYVYISEISGQKVLLHLHPTTVTFHVQGKGCELWMKEHFIIFGKQLHQDVKFNKQISTRQLDQTNEDQMDVTENSNTNLKELINQVETEIVPQEESISLHQTQEDQIIPPVDTESIDTDPKLLTVHTSTPATQHANNFSLPLISPVGNLSDYQYCELKEMMTHMMNLLSKRPETKDCATQYVEFTDSATQTDENDKDVITQENTNTVESNPNGTSSNEIDTENTTMTIPIPSSTVQTQEIPKSQQSKPKSARTNAIPQNLKSPKTIKTNNTLIIGSSLLKGIKTKGLKSTDVSTNRGATIKKLTEVVSAKDISNYKTIVLHIGGNDVSNRTSTKTICELYEKLIILVRSKTRDDCDIIVSGIPPRKDVHVDSLNAKLKEFCANFELKFIDHSTTFYDNRGYVNYYLYHRDGIHLSRRGTSTFLHNINQHVSILDQQRQTVGVCYFCNEPGHNTKTCRHKQKVLCYNCGHYGHKAKFCSSVFT